MRFYHNGPNIPDSLLEKRDKGQVVFLCGAGVSIPANMPDFSKLTRDVIDFFDPPEMSPVAQEFKPWREWIEDSSDTPRVSLDQIFHMLNQEYGRNEVNSQVARRLQVDADDSFLSQWHEIIMQLSADQEGNPQVVTTNFDLLFEYTSRGSDCPTHVPPAFPDIEHGVPLKGITYLHGRLQEPEASHHSYVLSSADFGRAYLSEGWATSFIQSLLTSYTVVLLGYSAEDPPVKYLLQGLNHDGGSDSSNLYAFDRGTQDEVDSKWDDRGVTAIAFSEYEQLWESLEAWRDRAVSPREWRANVFQLALKSPQELLAHERGQVAHIVRTTSGAKLFAHSEELPPADWLCVFDRNCRVAKQSKDYGLGGEVFRPIEVFGLDDDKQHIDSAGASSYEHLLEWRRSDANPPHAHKLGNRGFAPMNLPRRLEHITFWIANLINNPIVVWWAARQHDIHPKVLDALSHRFRLANDMHPKGRKVWALILESYNQHGNEKKDSSWFYFRDHLEREGWTKGVLRHFEEVTKPYISIERILGLSASKPPSSDWEELKVSDLVNFEIKFPPLHGESVSIPDEVLLEATQILSNNLVRAADLRLEVGDYDIESPTCYPNRDAEGRANSRHSIFIWLVSLFERLKDINPSAARAQATLWPIDEQYYFSKLKLYAYNMANLFEADEAMRFLLELSQEHFWKHEIRRELLFLVHDRWSEFSPVNKTELLTRLLDGPDKKPLWDEGEYENRRNDITCLYVKWLVLNGCELPQVLEVRFEEAIRALPEWRDIWARNATSKHFMQVRNIGTDESPAPLEGVPLNKVAQIAEACSERNFDSDVQQRPFSGLVASEPRRALASLSFESRRQKYPASLWQELISNWPKEVPGRLQHAFLSRMLTLPREVVRELKHTLGNWLRERFLSIIISHEPTAWKLFECCVDGFTLETEQNEPQLEGQREIASASTGPVADLTRGLLNVLTHHELKADQTIPDELKAKLGTLISVNGNDRMQVITTLCRRVQWLYQVDPLWVQDYLLPRFDFSHEDAEAAWFGYALSGGYWDAPVTVCLKPLILGVFPFLYEWGWDQRATNFFAQILVELTLAEDVLPAKVTAREARHCIRSMNSDDRREVVDWLSTVGKREVDGWSRHVVPFIDTVWPRERAFRTSMLTSEWLSLLASSGENFPNVLKSVRRFLASDGENGHWLYRFKQDTDNEKSLAELFPENVLDVLDIVIPNHIETVPYDLEEVLNLTVESKPTLLHDRRYIRLITLIENL